MSIEDLNYLFSTLGIGGIGVFAAFAVIKMVIPLFRRLNALFDTWESFIRDWAGEEEAPGRDRVPGVMERLNDIDGALKNNGGTSVKDAVDRIETKLEDIDVRLADGDKKFDDIYKQLKNIKDKF